MSKNLELRDVCSVTSNKKLNRCRSFHFRYLELCRSKNLTPLAEIRTKNNATSMLDFFGDKLGVTDWLQIVEALYYDQVLQTIGIRLRKSCGSVLDQLDTEKKAKLYRQKPVIYTKFIFCGVVDAISNCIEFNKNLRILNLEGLPLNDKYVESIAKALSSNESIKEISFQRSTIFDKGCEAICNTIKYLENVEKLNLSECDLTTKGAEFVADMIKIQKISRYTEGWQKSLRYRDVDPDSIPGLRMIALSRNPQIGDDGLKPIVEVLKEDVWVKVIEMENCGFTDRAANMILDCLELNNYIIDFNVRNNAGISKFLLRNIREQLGKEDEDKHIDSCGQMSGVNGNNVLARKNKITVPHLKEQLKTLEEQLAFERVLRKKAEQLNERLNQQIIAYENHMEQEANATIPEGYVVVKNESLQSIIRERNDFQKIVSNVCVSTATTNSEVQISHEHLIPLNNTMRSKQQNLLPPTQQHQNSSEILINGGGILKEQQFPRKMLKVRKVKSEMKYVEPLTKDTTKKKESKSDHEFANELDFNLTSVHFETSIGDTVVNNECATPHPVQITSRMGKKTSSCNSNNMNNNGAINLTHTNICPSNKFEIDELSLSTSRSHPSECCSSDSDTLRNSVDLQPMTVFIRRSKGSPTLLMNQQEHGDGDCNMDDAKDKMKSPRSLFFGLCDD